MASSKRIFITLWPSDSVRERLTDLQSYLYSTRVIAAQNYHMGASINSNFIVSARKHRSENRSLHGVNEDRRGRPTGTELTPQSRKKCIFRGAHITLAFLGDVQTTQIDKVSNQLARLEGTAIRETIDIWGTFPGPGVVWVGPSKPSKNIYILRKAIVNVCQAFTELDLQQKFVPHITLLRKAPATTFEVRPQLPSFRPIIWESNEFCLVESNRSQYQTLARFTLNAE